MEESDSWQKGERVPVAGTYRCLGCNEIWTADEAGLRFPPCDTCKTGPTRWVLVEEGVAPYSSRPPQ